MLPLLLRGVIFSFLSSVFAANSGSYAPNTQVSCPSSPIDLLRVIPPINQTLHPQEQEYISQRARTVPQAWQAWLGDGSAAGYDISLLRSHLPRVSIAISGGGERASLFGASVLQALDGRNATSVAAKTGGIFQLALYQAGNSGMLCWLAIRIF
jgi:lysophospholipase